MKIYISLSALLPSQYRQFVKKWDKTRYEKEFKFFSGDRNRYRLYFPLEVSSVKQQDTNEIVPKEIRDFLTKNGYVIEDYIKGIAGKKDSKNKFRIGKLLTDPSLKSLFDNDKNRQGSKVLEGKLLVIISRHPYDIAGMSTDRGWTSCQNLIDGEYNEFVPTDIKAGSLIAYVVKDTDKNINNPICRLKIIRYESSEGHYILMPAYEVYGTNIKGFKEVVQQFCNKVNSLNGHKPGTYKTSTEKVYLNDEDIKEYTAKDLKLFSDPKELNKFLDSIAQGKFKLSEKNLPIFLSIIKNTDRQDVLKKILTSEYKNYIGVYKIAASNINLTTATIEELITFNAEDLDNGQKFEHLVQNPNFTPKLGDLFVKIYAKADASKYTRSLRKLIENNKITDLDYIVNSGSVETIKTLIEFTKDLPENIRQKLEKSKKRGVLLWMLNFNKVSKEKYLELFKSLKDAYDRRYLYDNEHTTYDIIKDNFLTERLPVQETILTNRNNRKFITPELIDIASKSKYSMIRELIADSIGDFPMWLSTIKRLEKDRSLKRTVTWKLSNISDKSIIDMDK